jgi:radical SAM protein with 4Fe4S-binding SPASM domain
MCHNHQLVKEPMSFIDSIIIPLKNTVRSNPVLRAAATCCMSLRHFPAVVGVDPSGICNLNCTFCGTKHSRESGTIMSPELFEKILSELSTQKKLWMLILHNFGEPLINPHIGTMVQQAKNKSIARSIQFATNGTLLTAAISKALIEAELDGLVVSVDALTPEDYAALKGKNLLSEIISNATRLQHLKKELRSKKPYVSAKMVRRAGFENTFEPFLQKWSSIANEAALTPYSNWGGAVPEDASQNIPAQRYACHFLWYYPAIASDGRVFCCCATDDSEAILGNVNNNSLESLWNGTILAGIRKAHLEGNYSKCRPCSQCTYWAESRINLNFWFTLLEHVQ